MIQICYLNFQGVKGLAMATEFKQTSAKIALISVVCKKSRNFSREYSRDFGVRELKYVIRIFKGSKRSCHDNQI